MDDYVELKYPMRRLSLGYLSDIHPLSRSQMDATVDRMRLTKFTGLARRNSRSKLWNEKTTLQR